MMLTGPLTWFETSFFSLSLSPLEERSLSGLCQCLVELSTQPITVCHGFASNQDAARANAAHNALQYLKIMAGGKWPCSTDKTSVSFIFNPFSLKGLLSEMVWAFCPSCPCPQFCEVRVVMLLLQYVSSVRAHQRASRTHLLITKLKVPS